jgi:predicted dehydrogenase
MTTFANVGFVGCGSHATNNLYPMLKYSRCRLAAVCDLNEALARRNAEVYGGQSVYTDVDKMLAERKLDGVLVVGPAEMHYEVGKKVLQRGFPLFIEKPPAPDLKKAEELVQLAKAGGTFVMTGFMKRHGLTYAKIRSFIAAGQFVPATGLFRYTHWAMTDLRGMLMGMSIHPIDLAISFFGDVTEVNSFWRQEGRMGSLGLVLRFASGKFVHLVLGSAVRIQEHVEITGTMDGKDAAFVVDNVQQMELHTAGLNGIDLVAFKDGKWTTPDLYEIEPKFDLDDIKMWRPDYALPNMGQNSPFLVGYAGEIREFGEAILQKRQPYPSTEDTLKAMRVIEAVQAKSNGTTRLS